MKVLKVNERLWILLGTLSSKLKEPTNEFLKTPNSYLTLTSLCTIVAASATYFLKHFFKDSNGSDAILSFIQIVIIMSEIGSIVSIGINMKKVKRLHNELQSIVDKGYKPIQIDNVKFR